jgi:ABC-type antimicrobial peptide transport system permease subunit
MAQYATVKLYVKTDGAKGSVLGIAGALLLGPVLASVMFGVSSVDPLALSSGPVMVLLVALAASWIPARRAGAVSPVESLHAEA